MTDDAGTHQDGVIGLSISWLLQGTMVVMITISGYLMSKQLDGIEEEMRLSRIERTQIRADMSALEIGLRGDRFSRGDWDRERDRIERAMDDIRAQIAKLQQKHQ